jgi:hypothetical protein
MLISERKLRSIVREMISESLLNEVTVLDNKGSTFEVTPTGSVKLLKRGPGVTGKAALPYTFPPDRAPLVVNALLGNNANNATLQAAKAALGGGKAPAASSPATGGGSGSGSFGGSSSSGGTTSDPATAAEVSKLNFPPGKGIIVINRHDFFPLDSVSSVASKAATALIGQGHASAIIVNPNTGKGYRFEFGRYDEARKCKDERWITQAGNALFGEDSFSEMGIHTMGVALSHPVGLAAKVSKDGNRIENLKEFCASSLWGKEKRGESDGVVIPVSDINAALAFAKSMVGTCFPYALPGAGFLTTQDTMNCGVFAQRVLQAGKPDQVISVQARTLFDTPDALYQTAAGMGYQTAHF